MSFDPNAPAPAETAPPAKASQNILEFGTYHDAMTHPPIAEIRRYWDALRAGRLMPLRSEVDPRDMSSFLECCFILDRQNAGDTRFRVAGMALNELMGMELRGMHVRSVIEPAGRAAFSATLEKMFGTPEVQDYQLSSAPPHAPAMRGRLLVLPLKGDTGEVDRAMGCFVTEGIVGIPPRRFSVDHVEQTCLKTGARIYQETKIPANAGFAEAATPFATKPALNTPQERVTDTPTGVPYLRVVK